ncbi:hypothetical protein DCMF_04815 [Candidatus Formimonas warabiya]|uniref:DUF4238 domain-containing protein n=2 Tax=Formimonas warabiya TaxID=1761012 RepID=A0A3G1KP12_FORW1|nr:hypothetical protein DCMF_04815 [Candidatus Formimonas warabiya]
MTQIHCLNKLNDKKFITNIRNVASENYFYELPPDDAKKFETEMGYSDFNSDEKWFRNFESVALPLLDTLISICNNDHQDNLINFLYKEETRMWIGVFILLQFYRTKKFRQDLYKEGLSLGEQTVKERSDYSKEQLVADAQKYSIFQQIINYLDIYKLNDEVNLIGNYLWQIGRNDIEIPLVTSDSPIIELITNFANGISVKTWVFPLNDKYCLCIYFDFFTGKLRYLTHQPIIDLNKVGILLYNSLQLKQAHTFVFSKLPIISGFFNN